MARYNIDWERVGSLSTQYVKMVQGNGHRVNGKADKLRDEIVISLMPFIESIAYKLLHNHFTMYRRDGARNINLQQHKIPIEDLTQEGCIGVLNTLKNYNPELGKIRDYVATNAAGSMTRAAQPNESIIKISRDVWTKARQIIRNSENENQAISEIADILPKTFYVYRDPYEVATVVYRGVRGKIIGIDPLRGQSDDGPTLLETRSFENSYARQEDNMEDILRKEAIEEALGTLTERERLVIRKRFGLGGDGLEEKVHTLQAIGDTIGKRSITREAVRRIQKNALEQLRKADVLYPFIE